jgi:hypothetical protein
VTRRGAERDSPVSKHKYYNFPQKLALYFLSDAVIVNRVVTYSQENKYMTLIAELKKELRKEFETKVATLKQKEARIRQLAGEFAGPSAGPSVAHRPMPEEQRRKISEALKRRHSQSKPA